MIKSKKAKSAKVIPVTEKQSNFFLSSDELMSNESELFSREGQLSCDVFQTRDNIVVKSTIAGVDPKNLDISVSNDLLTIRGYREMDEEVNEGDFYAHECYWGTFSRSIVLPQEVDQNKVQATLKNGVLTIILPKKYKTTSIKVKHINE